MNARIALALGASLALHAAALGLLAWPALQGEPGHGLIPLPPKAVMRVRIVQDDVPVPLPVAAAPSTMMPADMAAAPAAAPMPAASSPPRIAAAPAGDPLAGFAPASQLTVKPVPMSVGDLEPDWVSELKGAAVATLSVYVAADGSVFHVEVRQASDPRIADLARKAFGQARYKPGMIQGKNVAARVDVSLDYEGQRDRVNNPDAARPVQNVLRPDQALPAAAQAPLNYPDKAPVTK